MQQGPRQRTALRGRMKDVGLQAIPADRATPDGYRSAEAARLSDDRLIRRMMYLGDRGRAEVKTRAWAGHSTTCL